MAHILIIDDDKHICETIQNIVHAEGYRAAYACTLDEGLNALKSRTYDVIFLDVKMPAGSGLDMLPTIQQMDSPPEVIILTGYGDADGAELAVQNGAWDYLEKPASKKKIVLSLNRALEYRQHKGASPAETVLYRENIVGESRPLKFCLDQVAKAADSETDVLITGETGTGKELVAVTIHLNSSRSGKNFVVVDCAALPKTLVESVLFGHEKGAFTGAESARQGLIAQAHEGTLFLDEVGELSLSLQKKFLRVLQERRFRPIGGKQEIESDFRLIAASNRNLEAMVKKNQFREDLLFRLRTFVIDLPPLRERSEDIKLLVKHYYEKTAEERGEEVKTLSADYIDALTRYSWPGNVRELMHTLEHANVAAGNAPVLYPKHFPNYLRAQLAKNGLREKDDTGLPDSESHSGKVNDPLASTLQAFREAAIEEAEQTYLKQLISHTGKNIKHACTISGLSRSRLYSLLKKYGLS